MSGKEQSSRVGIGVSPTNRFKLTAEVAGAAALTIVATGILPSGASTLIDIVSIGLPLLELPGHLGKIRRIRHEKKAAVRTPLRWEPQNLLHGQDTMFRKVDGWTSEMHGSIERRIATSKKKEGQDILHMGLYSGLILAGRSVLEVLGNIPHSGDGLDAVISSVQHTFARPELLNGAWNEFLQDPGVAFAQTLGVIGAITLTSALNYFQQRGVTKHLRSLDKSVDEAARKAKAKYDDTYLNGGERAMRLLGNTFRRLTGRLRE